jgi:hypothetical protein
MNKIAVTMATLESHNHIMGDIERGVKIYERGSVDFMEQEPGRFVAKVPHKGKGFKTAMVTFTRDGRDIDEHHCSCGWRSSGNPLCRHVVALVLAIQGGIVDSKIVIGKSATVSAKVNESNTALAVGSGKIYECCCRDKDAEAEYEKMHCSECDAEKMYMTAKTCWKCGEEYENYALV